MRLFDWIHLASSRLRVYGVLAVLVLALVPNVSPVRAADSGSGVLCPTPFTVFNVPTVDANPYAVASGPDGAVWFSELGGDYGAARKIGRVTTAGVMSEYPIPNSQFAQIDSLATGPNGAMWFTLAGPGGGGVGHMTMQGVVQQFTLPANNYARDIVAGPDGAMWFISAQNWQPRVGRISMTGEVSLYPVSFAPEFGTSQPRVKAITVGPDDAIWFVLESASTGDGILTFGGIGRMTTSGEQTVLYSLGPEVKGIEDLVTGPDGALWFTENTTATSRLGRITTGGDVSEYPVGPNPFSIVSGPDGTLWFTGGDNSVNRVTLSPFKVNAFYTPNVDAALRKIVQGPDGAMWFADQQSGNAGGNTIGRIAALSGPVQPIPTGLTTIEFVTAAPNLSWEGVTGASSYRICRDGYELGTSVTTGYADEVAVEGYHVYSVTAVDILGQESYQSKQVQLLVDKTAPTMSAPAWSANPLQQGQTAILSVVANDTLSGLAAVEYQVDDGAFKPMVFNSRFRTWRATFTSGVNPATDVTDGTHAVVIRATDGAGNMTTAATQLVVGVAAPTALTAASPVQVPLLSWNAAADADHYAIYRDGVVVGMSVVPSWSDTSGVTDGSHDYYVKAVTTAGAESGASNTVTVVVDTTAPVMGTAVWSLNPKATFAVSVLTVPASDATSGVVAGEFYVDTDPGVGSGVAMTLSDGNLTASFGSALAAGVYDVGVRARDAAGNWSTPVRTMLVVYDPVGLGITGKNKKDLVPSLAAGDVLPGLVSGDQTEAADYGFTVGFKNGQLDVNNDFHFVYETGTRCNSPQAANCHSFNLVATSMQWLVIDGANNSRGRFQGVAQVTIDGVVTTNPFSVEGVDGDRVDGMTPDQFTLKVFASGSDPATASPLYWVSGPIGRGNAVVVK